jgi:hypothetical protein
MTREEAINVVKEFISTTCLHLVDQEALETLIPELRDEDEELEKEIATWIPQHIKGGEEGIWKEAREASTKWGGIVARHFAQWQKERMIQEFETWLKGNLHHLSCWNADEFCTDLKCYLGMKNE